MLIVAAISMLLLCLQARHGFFEIFAVHLAAGVRLLNIVQFLFEG
jgi:hypothetical protein